MIVNNDQIFLGVATLQRLMISNRILGILQFILFDLGFVKFYDNQILFHSSVFALLYKPQNWGWIKAELGLNYKVLFEQSDEEQNPPSI